jgi:hypothetical protein
MDRAGGCSQCVPHGRGQADDREGGALKARLSFWKDSSNRLANLIPVLLDLLLVSLRYAASLDEDMRRPRYTETA